MNKWGLCIRQIYEMETGAMRRQKGPIFVVIRKSNFPIESEMELWRELSFIKWTGVCQKDKTGYN